MNKLNALLIVFALILLALVGYTTYKFNMLSLESYKNKYINYFTINQIEKIKN